MLGCRVLRVATISDDTEAEGPGRRWALWVQGCPIRCPGCCNPEMFDERAGTPWTIEDLVARMGAAADRGVEGITLLGGEPFAQAAGAALVARAAKARGLTVMVFSGYTRAELEAREDARPLLALTDLLVDGQYDRERPEPPPPIGRRWIGSTNQVMHYLTDAYSPDEPRMREANTVELHWRDGRLLVNGWPASADVLAASLRRGRRASS
jgi:anaerobic ribonucleoside-triphosphate reductase activating protein